MSPAVSVRLLLTQSDARLVAFARAGHERAFEALVQRYRRPLHVYCRRMLLSEERAEDALQQALLQAWLALRNGVEVSDVRPWLYRIAHNSAVNALRVSGYDYCKLNESLSGANAPQEDLDRRIAVREALAGLAALPEMQREALLRTAVEGRSHQQVARDLGLSENALRGLVYRARTTLRAAAGALTPSPFISWALGATRGTPVVERLAELGAGGGSAGLAGLLMKGGAVAVTASVLAGGIVANHHPRARHHAKQTSRVHLKADTTALTASTQPARWTATASAATSGGHEVAFYDPILHAQPHRNSHASLPPTTPPTPAPARVWPADRHGGGDIPTQPDSPGQATGVDGSTHHGDGSPGGATGQGDSSSKDSGHSRDGEGSGSPATGGESHEGTSSSSGGGNNDGGSSGGSTGSQTDGGGSHGGSGEHQTNAGGSGSQGTGESSKDTNTTPEEPAEHH
ncbi:MAG TPA: sigma-70 family RNA polymerase sigma factor [Solirubrobacteraceae bacterium]|jgi:RNA polymerase sigma factor (sigma-70 family)